MLLTSNGCRSAIGALSSMLTLVNFTLLQESVSASLPCTLLFLDVSVTNQVTTAMASHWTIEEKISASARMPKTLLTSVRDAETSLGTKELLGLLGPQNGWLLLAGEI